MKKAYPKRKRTASSNAVGVQLGFRSGLEDRAAARLLSLGQPVAYEKYTLGFTVPAKLRSYTPDFVLPNGIAIETKGHFTQQDRMKHLHIRECHPDLDLRFVFSRPTNTIGKRSKTTYAAWCEKHGFKWSGPDIPHEWVFEKPTQKRLKALRRAFK